MSERMPDDPAPLVPRRGLGGPPGGPGQPGSSTDAPAGNPGEQPSGPLEEQPATPAGPGATPGSGSSPAREGSTGPPGVVPGTGRTGRTAAPRSAAAKTAANKRAVARRAAAKAAKIAGAENAAAGSAPAGAAASAPAGSSAGAPAGAPSRSPDSAPTGNSAGVGADGPVQPAGAATVSMPRVVEPTAQRRPEGPSAGQIPPSGPLAPVVGGSGLRGKQSRKARLRMVRVDPWSVMKMAFALSIALAVVTVIAVFIVWSVLDTAGVWDSINTSIASLQDAETGEADFDVTQYVGLGRVMGFTMLIAAADVVLLTALATLGAFMYNLAAALLGGLEVTLAEDH